MCEKYRHWQIPLLILFTGMICRVAYLISFAALPLCDNPCGPDIGEYIRHMQCILQGISMPAQEQIHGPLYGYFLALLHIITGGSYFAMRLIQSFLVLACGLLIRQILVERTNRRTADFFFLLYAVYPPFILWQSDFYSENLLLIMMAPTLWFFHKRQYLFSGAATGLAALCHPVALFFAAGAGLWMLCRKKWKHLLRFAVPLVILLIPVSVMRSHDAGKPVFIQQNSGFNFYLGNSANADGTCMIPPGDPWNKAHAAHDDAGFRTEALQFIRNHPGNWILLLLKKTHLALHYRDFTTWSDVTPLDLIFLHKVARYAPIFLLIPGLAGLLCILTRRRERIRYLPFLILFFSIWVSQILLVTAGRYRILLMVAMMSFAAALPGLITRMKQKWHLLYLLPVFLLFAYGGPDTREKERDTARFILAQSFDLAGDTRNAIATLSAIRTPDSAMCNLLGTLYQKQNDPVKAERAFRNALNIFPENPNTHLNLGRIAEEKGDPATAYACYMNAVKTAAGPVAATAYFNAGTLLQRSGRADLAEEYYRIALKKDPLSPQPCRNLAILLMEKGDTAGAKEQLERAVMLDPADPQRKLDLAYILFQTGEPDRANDLVRQVRETAPDHPGLRTLFPGNQ